MTDSPGSGRDIQVRQHGSELALSEGRPSLLSAWYERLVMHVKGGAVLNASVAMRHWADLVEQRTRRVTGETALEIAMAKYEAVSHPDVRASFVQSTVARLMDQHRSDLALSVADNENELLKRKRDKIMLEIEIMEQEQRKEALSHFKDMKFQLGERRFSGRIADAQADKLASEGAATLSERKLSDLKAGPATKETGEPTEQEVDALLDQMIEQCRSDGQTNAQAELEDVRAMRRANESTGIGSVAQSDGANAPPNKEPPDAKVGGTE